MSQEKKRIDSVFELTGVFLLLMAATAFFIYQHKLELGWDFMAYVLNAKYLFADGTYFQILRPPLTPFLLGVFSIFGWGLNEYVYIIFTSILFFISIIKLAEALGFNRFYFYAISLSSYLLIYGLSEGSELLSISFFALFLAYLFKNQNFGHYLGLAALTRYSFLGFGFLIFFYRGYKKILKNFGLLILVLLPWFFYNFIHYGNFFFGIADAYANNIYFRKQYIFQPLVLDHFWQVIYYLAPLLILGLIVVIIKLFKEYKKNGCQHILKNQRVLIIISLVALFALWNYIDIPIKRVRFLFPLVIPITYFSYVGLDALKNVVAKFRLKQLLPILIILILIFFNFRYAYDNINKSGRHMGVYHKAIQAVESLRLQDCSIMSNAYVHLNYLGLPVQNYPRRELVEKRILEGEKLVLFKNIKEPMYVTDEDFLNSLPTLHQEDSFVIVGEETKCNTPTNNDKPFIYKVDAAVFETREVHTPTDPCVFLSFNIDLAKKVCRLINFKNPF